ncbi:AMP-binding protein [Arenimonas sp. MALMAid1274]|uniref:AMP-binding protein n=1 Tax=Arenimonas sp. MALMAid1274 TaxID=3411630 RepID=UPI003BA06BBF
MSGLDLFADALRRPDLRVLDGVGEHGGAQLEARVQAYADALEAQGLQRVASRLDNGLDWLALDLAIRRLDGVHVPLPTFFSAGQVSHALASSGAQALVTARGEPMPIGANAEVQRALGDTLSAWRLQTHAPALPEGTACITYTSGTTGSAKGVCLDAASMLAVAGSLVEAARPVSPRRHLCLMPLSTLLENVSGLYAALLSEADIAVPSLAEIGYTGASGLDVPTLLACLQRYQPHSAILLPQLLLALVTAAERGHALPRSLRFLAVGGGRVGPRLLARAAALGLPVYEGYGLTECASVVCLNRPGASRPGSVGRALPHARVQVVDGELQVHGVRCLGYLGEAGPPPGAIATGDLGHVDEDGYVHVTGRRKNVFITAYGRNVSPEWVESELLQHPDFAQAVVWGEARPWNVAVVWPRRAGQQANDLQAALHDVNASLPDYAQVRELVLADAPFTAAEGLLTANGRPRRDAILHRYADAIAQRYARANDPSPTFGCTP